MTTTSEENFKVVGKLRDRSDLSDEMKDLCAKLPIYRIRKLEKKQNDDASQMEDDVQQSDEVDDAPERVARGNKMIKWKSRFCFHSRGQHLCKFIKTKESVCIRKDFNSQRTGLGHQHGRRFIVLGPSNMAAVTSCKNTL